MQNRVNALIALGRWDEAVEVAHEALSERTLTRLRCTCAWASRKVAINRGDEVEAACSWHLPGRCVE